MKSLLLLKQFDELKKEPWEEFECVINFENSEFDKAEKLQEIFFMALFKMVIHDKYEKGNFSFWKKEEVESENLKTGIEEWSTFVDEIFSQSIAESVALIKNPNEGRIKNFIAALHIANSDEADPSNLLRSQITLFQSLLQNPVKNIINKDVVEFFSKSWLKIIRTPALLNSP